DVLKEAGGVSFSLFKIMVPVIIVVKILQELDLIRFLAAPLAPIMRLVGLPDSMGLVWATALINNLYSGMAVFVNLPEAHSMTAAQVTVLGVMMLVAHNLPIEIKIAHESGTRFGFQLAVRVLGAILLGWMLSMAYSWGGWLQEEATIIWQPEAASSGILPWAAEQVQGLGMVFLIIAGLVLVMRLLNILKISELLIRMLHPLLRFLGIGKEASTITVIGMTMGLAYGGGLIIHEAKSGRVGKKDIFFSLTLMGLVHSIIEDTMLMVVLGGHLSGLLWARLVFGLVFLFVLVKVVGRMSSSRFHRYLFKEPAAARAANA
ncbi:MAG: hypothetical protein ACOC0U_03690, partial [Desulfovibrionales bacterium]